MTPAERLQLISPEDYLAGELVSDIKHEYRGGYVYAMSGAKTQHNRIAMSVSLCLGSQLRGKKCEPFNSDMKVRVEVVGQTRFYYPDAMVVCDPNPAGDSYQERPVVIAEVLSDSTRRIDLGEKQDAYLSIPTLQAYLLIEQDQPRVVVQRRQAQGFEVEVYDGLEEVVPLSEINAQLPLKELYERVEFAEK